MGRASDEAGLNYWVGELKSGAKTREDAFVDFAWTLEFQQVIQNLGL